MIGFLVTVGSFIMDGLFDKPDSWFCPLVTTTSYCSYGQFTGFPFFFNRPINLNGFITQLNTHGIAVL